MSASAVVGDEQAEIGHRLENGTVKKRILIADDEARVRLIMHDSLQKSGEQYEIVTVSNGLEALSMVQEQKFDLVIADVRMPGMNGIDLTRALVTIRPDTRVIWVTAYGCQKAVMAGMELNVYRCLDKPIEISEIRHIVREALEGQSRPPQRALLPEEEHTGRAYTQ